METKQIHIKDAQKEYFIGIDDILFEKADGNYCDLYLTTRTAYNTVRIQLGQLWSMIEGVKPVNSHTLARIGRSFIINLKYLQFADPKNKTITLHTDKDVVLKDVPREAVKSLLMQLSKEKRKEVLRTEYIGENVLTVPVEELNDEHLMADGFEYVDLGLPSGTLWATKNLSEEIIPAYFAFDAARQVRGVARTPTYEEFAELSEECIFVWCKVNEKIQGLLATGPNGNRIFLPANGIAEGTEIKDYGEACCYWTGTGSGGRVAYSMQFRKGVEPANGLFFMETQTCCGRSIRPVISKEDVRKDE